MKRMMEEDGVDCVVITAANPPLVGRVSRGVSVLATDGAEYDKYLFQESCLQDVWTDNYAKFETFESE